METSLSSLIVTCCLVLLPVLLLLHFSLLTSRAGTTLTSLSLLVTCYMLLCLVLLPVLLLLHFSLLTSRAGTTLTSHFSPSLLLVTCYLLPLFVRPSSCPLASSFLTSYFFVSHFLLHRFSLLPSVFRRENGDCHCCCQSNWRQCSYHLRYSGTAEVHFLLSSFFLLVDECLPCYSESIICDIFRYFGSSCPSFLLTIALVFLLTR